MQFRFNPFLAVFRLFLAGMPPFLSPTYTFRFWTFLGLEIVLGIVLGIVFS